MPGGGLPDEGELRLGPVTLPAGRLVYAGGAAPAAWVTRDSLVDAGRVWAMLSGLHPGTGLVPFLLGGLPQDPGRPWDTGEFSIPADPAGADDLDAAQVLAEMWDGEMPTGLPGDEDDEEWQAMRAPFSRQFPGLARPADTPLTGRQLDEVLGQLPAARIGLVRAARPADVLPLIGWTPSDQSDALPVAAVARSWEDRFGARLLRVGFAEISLLASRPPRTAGHAQRVAAEQFVFCDECAGRGLHDVPRITASLLESPIWTFWWD
jgi:hypothetical protein